MKFKKIEEIDYNTRVVTKFLWFPKNINGKTRWLETATWEETFELAGYATPSGWYSYSTRWIN